MKKQTSWFASIASLFFAWPLLSLWNNIFSKYYLITICLGPTASVLSPVHFTSSPADTESWEMKLEVNGGFFIQKLAKVRAPLNGWFADGQRPVVMKGGHEKCPSFRRKVQFLCSSPKLISKLTGAPSHDDVSSRVCRIPIQTRSQEIQTLDLTFASQQFMYNCDPLFEPVKASKQTNKQTNQQTQNIYTEWFSGQERFPGPILIFPMWSPGLNTGPAHMVQGAGYLSSSAVE